MEEINYPVNLLLVDDDTAILKMIAAALDGQGINVLTCSSPQQAWQRCVDEKISIALVDVHMPGINGYELLASIKNNPRTSHILVVLVTGRSMNPQEIVHGLSLGAVDYLFKPLDLHILNAKVRSLVALIRYQLEIEDNRAQKEIFLANMSHELRTPVNSLISLIYLLKSTNLDEGQLELLGLMDYTSRTLLGIVNDVLESAKIDAGKVTLSLTETDLRHLLKNVCEMLSPLAKEKGIALSCELADDVPAQVLTDTLRLSQILINLINNAIKFTEAGSVMLRVFKLQEQDERVQLAFTVADTGIGIPAAAIKRIFKRFEQVDDPKWRRSGGSGLGLSIVKKLIELMEGSFQIESEVGKGTRFNFNLWLTLQAPAAAAPEV